MSRKRFGVRARFRWRQRGQSAFEYLIVCAVLAISLGVGMSSDDSVLLTLLKAFRTAYQKLSFALSLPS